MPTYIIETCELWETHASYRVEAESVQVAKDLVKSGMAEADGSHEHPGDADKFLQFLDVYKEDD